MSFWICGWTLCWVYGWTFTIVGRVERQLARLTRREKS